MSDFEQDKAMMSLVDDAIKKVASHQFPPLVATGEGDETRLSCPWCFAGIPVDDPSGLMARVAGAFSESAWHIPDDLPTTVTAEDDSRWSSTSMTTLYLIHVACGNPVNVPDGWDLVWT